MYFIANEIDPEFDYTVANVGNLTVREVNEVRQLLQMQAPVSG